MITKHKQESKASKKLNQSNEKEASQTGWRIFGRRRPAPIIYHHPSKIGTFGFSGRFEQKDLFSDFDALYPYPYICIKILGYNMYQDFNSPIREDLHDGERFWWWVVSCVLHVGPDRPSIGLKEIIVWLSWLGWHGGLLRRLTPEIEIMY